MWFYIFIFVLLFALSFTKRTNTFWFWTCAIILLLIGGFRGTAIGTDTRVGYYHIFQFISAGGQESDFLWCKLNQLAVALNLGYEGVLFLGMLCVLLPVCYVIQKEVENKVFALATYYGMFLYLQSFNMIRQCIAMSFCLTCLHFFTHKNYFKSLACIIVGFLFHDSALIFLAAIVFTFIPVNFLIALVFCLMSAAFGLLANEKLLITLAGPYSRYLISGAFGFRDFSWTIIALTVLMNGFFLFYLFTSIKSDSKNPFVRILKGDSEEYTNPWMKCILVGMCCLNATQNLTLGTRLVLYFTQAQIVFYPNYLAKKDKWEKWILLGLFIAYLFANFMKILVAWDTEICPYNSSIPGIINRVINSNPLL